MRAVFFAEDASRPEYRQALHLSKLHIPVAGNKADCQIACLFTMSSEGMLKVESCSHEEKSG
jgi:hypothetical protein